jgi:hypothetical protein
MARRLTESQIAKRLERLKERQMLALRRLVDWPEGMPPTNDAQIGALVSLERDGFAQRLPDRDPVMGDLRFVITEAGRKALQEAPA